MKISNNQFDIEISKPYRTLLTQKTRLLWTAETRFMVPEFVLGQKSKIQLMKYLNKLSYWYFSRQAFPYWCILLADSLIVAFSAYVGHYLELGGSLVASNFWQITLGIILALVPFASFFHLFHTYSGILRYSSFVDLQRVAWATFFGSLATFLLGLVVGLIESESMVRFPHLLGCLTLFAGSTFLMWVERIMVKRLFDSFHADGALPVAIYGTREGGVSIAKSISTENKKKYRVSLFITDEDNRRKTYLLGHKIVKNQPGIGEILKSEGVRVLLVSPLKSEIFRDNQAMVDEIVDADIKIMMMPMAEEWEGKNSFSHQQLHEVEIEDLLPREKIEVDMNAIGALLTGKCILITGAAGSIGSEMVRQIAVYKPAKLILIDQAETPMHDIRLMMKRQFANIVNETIVTSITDRDHMEMIFSQHRPEYVFHAAAYKHVPMMEDNPIQAVRNNIYGTRVIADLAVKYGTKKFVMISTDKAVNPTNVMGCSKRICEIYCQSLNKAIQDGTLKPSKTLGDLSTPPITQFVTTRFGNVLGSNGSVIPLFKEQIRKGGPITVTHPDIIRFFMLIPEACKLVLEAGTMGKGGEIFVFDMGKPVKIVDLAKRMIRLSGAKSIEIKFTGLRDGEKLFEEVLNDKEGTIPTHHPKIMKAKVREYDYMIAQQNEDALQLISESHDDMAIVKKMKEIVPEYKSKCSRYEVLD